jgi:hypothetical protein
MLLRCTAARTHLHAIVVHVLHLRMRRNSFPQSSVYVLKCFAM